DYATDPLARDPGCSEPADTSEKDVALVCDDGIDNDEDGRIDYRTDGTGEFCCTSPTGSSEACACASAVAGGSLHTCALKVSGLISCWGENGNGQLGRANTTD